MEFLYLRWRWGGRSWSLIGFLDNYVYIFYAFVELKFIEEFIK